MNSVFYCQEIKLNTGFRGGSLTACVVLQF